jgi:class 3 adenylate cyclase/drug/metabolite transporter (DMT)-like permease
VSADKGKLSPHVSLLAAALIWGASPVLIKVLLNVLPASAIVAGRYLVASVALAPFAIVIAFRNGKRATARDWLQLLAVGVLGSGIGQLLFVNAVDLSSAGIVNALSKSQPLFVVFLGFFVLRERVSSVRFVLVGMMVAACVLIGAGEFGAGKAQLRDRLLGDGLALCAGLVWALAVVLGKNALRKFPPEVVALVRFGMGFGVASGVMVVSAPRLALGSLSPLHWALFAALGLICGTLALVLYYRGLAGVEAHVAPSLELVGPTVTVVLGWLVLGETLNPWHVAGICTLLFGAYLMVLHTGRAPAAVDEVGGAAVDIAPPAGPPPTPTVREPEPRRPSYFDRGPVPSLPEVRFSLRLKIASLAVALVISAMVAVNHLAVQHTRRVIYSEMESVMANLADTVGQLSVVSSPPAWLTYQQYLGRVVGAEFRTRDYSIDVVYIAVRDESDAVRAFAVNPDDELRNPDTGKPYTSRQYGAARDLVGMAETGQLGRYGIKPVTVRYGAAIPARRVLDIGYRQNISERFLDRIMTTISAVTLGLAVIGILLSVRLADHLTQPIERLTAAMQRVGEGDLEQHVTPGTSDEVGVMTVAFNRMVVGLRERAFLRAALTRYVSVQVAEKMIEEGEWWFDAEPREVTVLFADIRGFTPLTERLDSGEVFDMLNEYFAALVEAIFKHDGTLDKFMGDCIMAVWGSPYQMSEHALGAVRAGMDMQAAIARVNVERQAQGMRPINMGIGISTGSVHAGSLGALGRMGGRLEYAVIGDDVNLAQRIESQAEGGKVLISETTYEAVKEHVTAQPLEPVQVKGKSEKVLVYDVARLTEDG